MTTPELIPPAQSIIGETERVADDAVQASGQFTQGPPVAALERGFGDRRTDCRAGEAVDSGTSGLFEDTAQDHGGTWGEASTGTAETVVKAGA